VQDVIGHTGSADSQSISIMTDNELVTVFAA
jgi:hypothetical protein